jgi:hypothetical protein
MMVCKSGLLGENPPVNQTTEEIVLAEMGDFIETGERRKHVRKLVNRGEKKNKPGIRQDRHTVYEFVI